MALRKIVLILILSVLFVFDMFSSGGYFIGDGGSGKRILVYSSTIENANTGNWGIASKLKRDLINDLVNYSNMDIIDSEEKSTIRKLQKDSLSSMYSEDDPVELGKTIQAKSYIRLVTTCKKNTYSLTATITNIETGKTEGSFTSPFYSEGDYISKVHGEAAVSLFDSLGVRLTVAGKRLLQYDSFTQTESESKENLEIYRAELARLEKEQQEIKTKRVTEIDAEALNARIEVQKATLLQQQKNEEDRLSRLREDAKRKLEEENLSKERNAESQKKILQLSNEIEEKAAKIRQAKTENMTALQQIDVIEGEKQILSANETSINENISTFNEAQDIACKNEIDVRRKQKTRKSDLNTDGSLNDTGKRNLESDIEAIRLKYEKLKTENESQLKLASEKTQKTLREKIMSDMHSLERKSYSADSLSDTGVYFRIGNYDGTSSVQGWNYKLTFVFGGQTVYTEEGILTYESLTGQKIPAYPSANEGNREKKITAYNEYQDTVETYDSFFRLNVPYIQATLKYSITAQDSSKPSEYKIKIAETKFENIQNNKQISKKKMSIKETPYIYIPATPVDWTFNSYYVSQNNNKAKNVKIVAYGIMRQSLMEYANYIERETGGGLGVEFTHKRFRKGMQFGSTIHLEANSVKPKSFICENGFSIRGSAGVWLSVPFGQSDFSFQPSLECGLQFLKMKTTDLYKDLEPYLDLFGQASFSFRYLNKNNGCGFEIAPSATVIPYSENVSFSYGARAGILYAF